MRRDLALLVGTAAVVAMMLGGTLLIPVAERAVRHTDARSSQPELPSPIALLSGYSAVVSELLSGRYANASGFVSYLNSSYVPENVRYLFSRFNSLLDSALSDLNRTEVLIGDAREALSLGMIGEAKSLAGNASSSLWRANTTAAQVRESAATVASQLKVPQVRTGVVGALEARIAQLAQELSALRSEISEVESGFVVKTRITMTLDASVAWVGSPVTARGFLLTEGGAPVAGETVYVSVPGGSSRPEYPAVTGADGSYSVTFTAPYLYVDSVKVYAYYVSTSTVVEGGGGARAYAGSRSPDAVLSLLWVEPRISVQLNATRAKPGDWVLVSGTVDQGTVEEGGVDLSGSGANLKVRISAFGATRVVESSGGRFSSVVQVPSAARSGMNEIAAAAIPSGVFGPASDSTFLEVYRIPTTVTLELPSVALSGTSATVSGRVSSSTDGSPIPGASVAVTLAGSSAPLLETRAGDDGSFSVTVPVDIGIPTGWTAVSARASPPSAAYSGSSASASFFAVNPSVLAAPLAGAALLYASVGRIHGSGKGGKVGAASGSGSGSGSVASADLGSAFAQKQPGPAVSAYRRAAALVGEAIRSAIGKSETMREFLHRASSSLGEKPEPFAELTVMAEEELYAERSQDPDRAGSLLNRLISWLSGMKVRIVHAFDTQPKKEKGSGK